MTELFPPLSAGTRGMLRRLPGLIDRIFPLPGQYRAGLKYDVAELSRLLTSGREERGGSYLGKPALLSAYLRYFLPWNIYRLCRLFASLPLELKPNDSVNDFGTGPLTLASALWISRPDLRALPLEFRCVDRTAAVLEAGKKFFAALSAETTGNAECPWTARTIRGELQTRGLRTKSSRSSGSRGSGSRRGGALSVDIRGKRAALSAAVNVYNELFWNFSPRDTESLERFAESQARLLSSLTDTGGSILVVEPGIPRSGEFISLLRSSLMEKGRAPLSPCTHSAQCPLPGGWAEAGGKPKAGIRARAGIRERWCHFAFDTEDAPDELHKLSAAAGIPKERAVLSFIFAGPASLSRETRLQRKREKIRIISDSFPVDEDTAQKKNTWGRYGCCERGLVLVSGSREGLDASPSGALEELPLVKGAVDGKSGALVAVKK